MYTQMLAILSLAFIRQVVSLTITHPTAGDTWTTSGPNTISWNVAPGDPSYINVQLVHNNSTSFEPITNLLSADGFIATGIAVTSGYIFLTPSCEPGNPSLPNGSNYSLHFISEGTDDKQTVVNSTVGTFNIISGNATMCLGSDTSTSASPGASGSASSNLSSSSSSSHAGAIAGGVIGGLAICGLLVGGVLYSKHRRNLRNRKTQEFMMRKNLASERPVDLKVAPFNA